MLKNESNPFSENNAINMNPGHRMACYLHYELTQLHMDQPWTGLHGQNRQYSFGLENETNDSPRRVASLNGLSREDRQTFWRVADNPSQESQ